MGVTDGPECHFEAMSCLMGAAILDVDGSDRNCMLRAMYVSMLARGAGERSMCNGRVRGAVGGQAECRAGGVFVFVCVGMNGGGGVFVLVAQCRWGVRACCSRVGQAGCVQFAKKGGGAAIFGGAVGPGFGGALGRACQNELLCPVLRRRHGSGAGSGAELHPQGAERRRAIRGV